MEAQTMLRGGINMVNEQFRQTPSTSVSYELPYEIVHFKAGEVVFKEGEVARGLYYVQSGCVKVIVNRSQVRGRTTSSEFVTKLVSPGEFFGYKNLIRNVAISTHAVATAPTTVWIYPKEFIASALNNSNPLVKMLLKQAVADIEGFEETNEFHYLASVQERIAHQLVLLSDKFGTKKGEGTCLNLKLTRNEFAQLASTINESLSRHLTDFKNEGLIDLNGKEIIIVNRDGLVAKSGEMKH
jgi:CRP/FNR family cyclic AMP-dependent transcriptional regulator